MTLQRQALGRIGEELAVAELERRGYAILARRYRTARGEIDIIAEEGDTLVFVEVKARATLDEAAEAVLPRQQQRIAAAAEAWLATYPDPKITDMRFDAVLVAPGKLPRHIQGAFETS
jgi:putative endonuclease